MNLLKMIPKNQLDLVFGQKLCDIEPQFMGFIDIYEKLSHIIPKHFTVIDLGCAYAPQCFCFAKHKKYIGVDSSDMKRFRAPNTEHIKASIREYIMFDRSDLETWDFNQIFAICSYVPLKEEDTKLVRRTFKNLFMYYPAGGMSYEVIKKL